MPGLVGGLPATPSSARVLLLCQTSMAFSCPLSTASGSSPGWASDWGRQGLHDASGQALLGGVCAVVVLDVGAVPAFWSVCLDSARHSSPRGVCVEGNRRPERGRRSEL